MKKKVALYSDMSYEDMEVMKTGKDGIIRFYYEHFHANSRYLYYWIYNKLNYNRELTEEIHQETMLRALESRQSLRETDQCKTWLCTIASHLISDRFRQTKRDSFTSLDCLWNVDSEGEEIYSQCEDLVFREASDSTDMYVVMKCLNNLSEKQRYVIYCHHFGDLTFQEIAQKMGESPNTVSSWYYRGCKKLRELLGKEGGFEDYE